MEKEILKGKNSGSAAKVDTMIRKTHFVYSDDPDIEDTSDVEYDMEVERLYEDSMKSFKEGDIVKGRIVGISEDSITVDIGFKSEGSISRNEFPHRGKNLKVGDEITVMLDRVEDKNGQIVLSKEKADKIKVWENVMKMYANHEPVEGTVVEQIKGGLTVDIGLKAFLPGSQIDIKPVRNLDRLIGQKFRMKIIKMNKKKGNIVLSRRILLEEERKTSRDTILSTMEEGKIVDGTVKNITEYGAFIELESGVEGLIHVSEMSWGKYLKHPSKIAAVGDTVEAVVLNIDKEKRKISLSMKQNEPNPWLNIEEKYQVGAVVEGKIRNVTDFGAFVELEEGIDGLIHISDMSWAQKIKHPSELFKKRDSVKAVVLSVEKENERLALGIKQLTPDPWKKISEKDKVGMDVKGKVIKITTFGAFAEIEAGIEGLIHISQLSSKKVNDPKEVVSVGDEIKARVVKVDDANRRIGLSIKAYNEGISNLEGLDIPENGFEEVVTEGEESNKKGKKDKK